MLWIYPEIFRNRIRRNYPFNPDYELPSARGVPDEVADLRRLRPAHKSLFLPTMSKYLMSFHRLLSGYIAFLSLHRPTQSDHFRICLLVYQLLRSDGIVADLKRNERYGR
ncbi:uncharacterized protein ATNIH1004_004682 [Aspergillus tanneri]|uniref:Uncharacterized protein n=1 Tax=Aspergillus tanneri TaxID=1220188 RepID=A0A5M9N2L4_9EURO|nr:uncharacterized protein ATNIH1004_004682 [Aspergillus tanneri]KAA8648797.1 hypothetical protein ATNIH1004_004682 [Aspergillus tanneri]